MRSATIRLNGRAFPRQYLNSSTAAGRRAIARRGGSGGSGGYGG